ncbi:MAG: hypothetical protein QOF29_2672, partial [bacterium]
MGVKPRAWWAAVPIVAWGAYVAYDLALPPRHDIVDPIPDTLRALAAAVVLFGVCGLGVTRLLLPDSLRRHELLWVLPTGACASGLALMALGFAGIPFLANLVLVLVAGAALSARSLRAPPRGAPPWPVFLAAAIVAVALMPMVLEVHFATVTGTGSDAHLAAGAANYLQHGYPTGNDARLPVDQMPLLWKSKYPIYYAFAGVAKLAGLETWQTLVPLAAVLLALAALGMFLVARDLLGAGVAVSACAMGFAGLDRMVLHTGLNPYFNQTWGAMTLPFALVLAWWAVRPGEAPEQRRRTAGLLAIFLGVLALAYPLALPIAAMPLLVFLWRERRKRIAEGRPVPRLRSLYRGPRSLVWMIPTVLILLVPLNGVSEKLRSAARIVFDPHQTLIAWAADLPDFIPLAYFMNLPDDLLFRLAIVPIVVLAFLELRRHQPRTLYLGLALVFVVALFEAWTFRNRDYGQYFHFKILAFILPLLLVVAAVHVGRLRRVGPVVLAAFAVATGFAVRDELRATGLQLGQSTVALADWAHGLPRDASVRLDMSGPEQLWGAYFLAARRTCAELPLTNSDYPHVAQSRKADYVVVSFGHPRPDDAVGAALRRNQGYRLFRL